MVFQKERTKRLNLENKLTDDKKLQNNTACKELKHWDFSSIYLSVSEIFCLMAFESIYLVNVNVLINRYKKKTLKFFESNRKAMNRNWSNQKANPTLKTKTGNKINITNRQNTMRTNC